MRRGQWLWMFVGYEVVAYLVNRAAAQRGAVHPLPLDLIGAVLGYGAVVQPVAAPLPALQTAAAASAPVASPMSFAVNNFAQGFENVVTGIEGFVT